MSKHFWFCVAGALINIPFVIAGGPLVAFVSTGVFVFFSAVVFFILAIEKGWID